MKRFVLVAFAASALLVPALVSASSFTFVYRPELRQMVPVPQPFPKGSPVLTRSINEDIARHEQMAQAFRGTRMAQSAVHCDRLVKKLRDARKAN